MWNRVGANANTLGTMGMLFAAGRTTVPTTARVVRASLLTVTGFMPRAFGPRARRSETPERFPILKFLLTFGLTRRSAPNTVRHATLGAMVYGTLVAAGALWTNTNLVKIILCELVGVRAPKTVFDGAFGLLPDCSIVPLFAFDAVAGLLLVFREIITVVDTLPSIVAFWMTARREL